MSEGFRPNRRSFLAQVVGSSFATGGAFSAVTGFAFAQAAQRRTCLTDRDGADRSGYGTFTGLNDQDSSDRAGRGTYDGVSDRDGADQQGRGVGERCALDRNTAEAPATSPPTGVSDSDSGPYADRPNYGHGGSSRAGVADNDSGPNADRAGHGRGSRAAPGGLGGNTLARETPAPSAPPPSAEAERAPAPGGGRTRGITRSSSNVGFPAFPWPPPAPSSRLVLPRGQFTAGTPRASLYDVGTRLTSALERARYSEYSFYSVPNGFALVARLERFLDDGSSAPDTIRYVQPANEPFSFMRYLTGLFVAPVGNYRQIAFIVTNAAFVASGKALSDEEAEVILRNGANVLPAYFRSIRFGQDYVVTALIYEFQKRPGEQALSRPSQSRLGARVHLERSGIEPALERQ